MKKTAVYVMLAAATAVAGCKSQATAEDTKTAEEMVTEVQANPLLRKDRKSVV